MSYRFVSDFPFKDRAPHVLDDFEKQALAALRSHPNQKLTDVSWSLSGDRVRPIAPVVMGAACVACHNSHPESPKRDWQVGDVRGIQEIAISQAFANNLFSFKYLLAYFVFMAATGVTFIAVQQRQAATIRSMNGELETANEFLASAGSDDSNRAISGYRRSSRRIAASLANSLPRPPSPAMAKLFLFRG